MKFNKKTAALALTAIMAVGSSNLSVFAADLEVDTENEIAAEVESDTDEYDEDEDPLENIGGAADPSTDILYGLIYFNEETQMITGYYDDGSRRLNLVIPSEINGIPVLGIADGAFLDWWGLYSVVIEEGIQTIGKEAFKYCELMKSIDIPSTVTEIGFKAFYGDGALSEVYFTEDSELEKIDGYAFAYCDLGTFRVPASVNTIETCAFAGCELMSECIFEGDAPENISGAAFANYIEDYLTIYFYEGQSGFTTPYWLGFDCKMISRGDYSFIVDEDTGRITGCVDNIRPIYSNGVIQNLQDLVIPSNINGIDITGIDRNAFYDWDRLGSVTIESGVENIDEAAFRFCNNLKTVHLPNTVTEIGKQAFADTPSLEKFTIEENSQLNVIDTMAFSYSNLNEIVIPSSVTDIYEKAFYNCSNLMKVYFEGDAPDNIDESENIFMGCSDELVLYFYEGKTGYTTPEWLGQKCVMISTSTEPDVWNFSDTALKSLGTITSNVTIDDLTIIADSENPVQVKENPRTLDGVTYDYCLSLRGKGNISKRAIKLDVTKDCTISIAAASNSDSRSLTVVKEDGTVLGTIAAGKELSIGSVEYTGRVDSLYIYSEKDNVNVYAINVDYK